MPESTAQNEVTTDLALQKSGRDMKILRDLHNLIEPELFSLGGWRDLDKCREGNEDCTSWGNALYPTDLRGYQCIRLTKPSAILLGYHNRIFSIVVFLVRNGEFITAVRRYLDRPDTYEAIQDDNSHRFAVLRFEKHETPEAFVAWWREFCKTHGAEMWNNPGNHHMLVMKVVRGIGAMLDATEERREKSLEGIRSLRRQAEEIYPHRQYAK